MICTPGVKTFIVDIVKQMFTIIKDINSEATITAASGIVIKSTTDFPKGSTFSVAFKPVQSNDTKSVKMIFNLTRTTSPSFQTIEGWHTNYASRLA